MSPQKLDRLLQQAIAHQTAGRFAEAEVLYRQILAAAPGNFDGLIKDLAAADFATRDKARQELERMGPAILPLLKPLAESKDAEVAAVAGDLVKRLGERGQARAIRRLMAIRTLGERKEKGALPLLNSLKDSKELLVGDYARRAIAQINGEKLEPVNLWAKLEGDLALLPADAAVVGQTSGLNDRRMTIASVIEKAVADSVADMYDVPVMPDRPAPEKPDAPKMIRQASEKLLAALERVGDVRIDAITFGGTYTKDDAGDHGWFAVIVRGQYDAAAVFDSLKGLIRAESVVTPAEKPGDVASIAEKNGGETLLFPNNEEVIFLAASNDKDGQAVRERFVAALKSGKGGLEGNRELAAMMKTVDTKAPLWMVCKFTDAMSKEMTSGQFQTLTIDTKAARDGTDFTFNAQAPDADKAKAGVEQTAAELKGVLTDVQQEMAVAPALKSVADLLGSIKMGVEGTNATLTGQLPAGILKALIGELPVQEMLAPREVAPPVEVPEQAVDPQPR